jgi:hypothetical protein
VQQIRTVILFCLLFSSVQLFSQSPDIFLLGSWQPKTYHQLKSDKYPEAENAAMAKMGAELFRGVRFTFNADHSCRVDLSEKSLSVNKAHWQYDPVTQQLSIIEWADRHDTDPGLLFGITIRKDGGKHLWHLYETPIVLEMVKVTVPSNKVPVRPSTSSE